MSLIPRKRMSSDLLDPKPKKGSFNGVTSDGVYEAIGEATDNILDDGSTSESIVVAVPSSQSSNYIVGNYYRVLGKIARLRTKTEGDNVTQLTFDTTSGVIDAVNGVIEDISSIGSPLQWKGPATVAQLNAGITGIQPGWTYTLTDAGTLTDGSIVVDVGDEVSWTGTAWFKVGGENSNVALFKFSGTDYPLNSDMNDEFLKGKTVVLMHRPGGTLYDFYYLVQRASGSGHVTMYFKGRYDSIKVADDTWTFYNDSVNAVAIAPLYDPTSTYPTVGTAVMYYGKRYVNNTAINTSEDWNPAHWTEKSVEDEIGNVETLLAAL